MYKKLSVLFLTLVFFFVGANPAFAAPRNFAAGELTRLNREEKIEGDYFATGEKVEILGTVNGDVYAASGFIVIDGVVNGDVIAAGGNILISGVINGNVRLAGGQIDISNKILGSATLLGGNLTTTKDSQIGRGLVALGGNINLQGGVGNAAKIAGGNVTLANKIRGDVDAAVGSLYIDKEASVSGQVNYWSENEANVDNEATLAASLTRHEPPQQMRGDFEKGIDAGFKALNTFFGLASLITTVIVGLILLKLFPNLSLQVAKVTDQDLFKSGVVGILVLVITPLVFLFFVFTLIGIPLAALLTVVFFTLLYVSRIFVMLLIGQKLLKDNKNIYWQFLIGLLLYYLLMLIPFIGGLVKLVVTLVGLGGLTITLREHYSTARSKKIY